MTADYLLKEIVFSSGFILGFFSQGKCRINATDKLVKVKSMLRGTQSQTF